MKAAFCKQWFHILECKMIVIFHHVSSRDIQIHKNGLRKKNNMPEDLFRKKRTRKSYLVKK